MSNNIGYMFEVGFFGTRAPLFMDLVTLIVALLPFFVAIAISFARNKHYSVHSYLQIIIFSFSVIVLSYFEYGVRVGGGFAAFMKDSGVSYDYALVILVLHIIIAVITVVLWATAIFGAKKILQRGIHRKIGLITFAGVVLTSVTGIWVYFLMFVY
jgi:putative membrane protein